MEKKNQVLMSVLGVFALVIVTVGVSYAFFTYTRTSTNTGTITAGDLDFGFTETAQELTLEDAWPISNTVGEAATADTANVVYYEFQVSYNASGALTTTHDVELVKQDGATLDDKYVKVALFNGTNQVGTTKTLAEAIATPMVNDVAVTSGVPINYTLKMWIDADVAGFDADDSETGVLPGDENYTTEDGQTASAAWAGKTVSVKVKVSATGTAQ